MTDAIRLATDEYAPYYGTYVQAVPPGPILEVLDTQLTETLALLRSIPAEREEHRYAPGKWSIKELVGHIVDTERIFAFRALAFARRDGASYPGMDQDDYVRHGRFEARTLADLTDELELVRRSNLALFRTFDADTLAASGTASDCSFTVRALLHIIAGHLQHHLGVLRERYLTAA